MNKMQRQVKAFHEAFGHTVNDQPRIPSIDDIKLRILLMQEELLGKGELAESMEAQDLIGVADGLADLLYVTIGTAVVFGIDIEPIFDEVHRSNMSKLGGDGEPIISRGMDIDGYPLGKVMKGPNFFEPAIGKELNEQTTYGHDDKLVYPEREVPLRINARGPVVGTATIQMDHNGNMDIVASMNDVSTLPIINHLGFSVSGISINEEEI